MNYRLVGLLGFSTLLIVVATACNGPTLIETIIAPDGSGDDEDPETGDGDGDGDSVPKLVDVLLIIDNSASMCEEQAQLVEAFFDADCPVTDLNAIAPAYQNPDAQTLNTLSARCGFLQLLGVVGIDARVGVVSTDVGPCDDRFNFADDPVFADVDLLHCGSQPGDWGRRPQRGCLIGAPGDEQRFVEVGDPDALEHFAQVIGALGSYGSPFERGFDQLEAFLEQDTAPGCVNDASDFLRPSADLVVIFLSDEDDCSHLISEDFPDENAGELCTTEAEEFFINRTPAVDPSWCYSNTANLRPVDDVVANITLWGNAQGKEIRVATITGGLYEDGRDEIMSAGCVVDENGKPDGFCTPSQGASNNVASGGPCDPEALSERGLPPCCAADPGTRYHAFANAFGEGLNDSICYYDYRQTLLEVTRLAAGL